MVSVVSKAAKRIRALKSGVLFVLLFFYIMPFFLVVINSFKQKRSIAKNPLALLDPAGPTMSNFINAWNKMQYPKTFMNSLFITLLSVLFIIIISSMTAWLFVRTKSMVNGILFSLMIAGMVVPFQSLMIPLVSIYGAKLNMLNSRLTLVFLYLGFGVNMAVFIYHGFIKSSIPIALEEAALLDGCNKFQTFFLIVFPLLKSITATLVVLDVLWIWNDYLLPSLVLGKEDLFTLPLSTFSFYDAYTVDYGGIMAALVLTIIPILILYIFLQKQIISGVLAGSVKS